MNSLSQTPQSERTHIALFGRRNTGKSSLLNALTGQQAALVSDIKGTTTDPVAKSMELPPLGPVVIFDTPGIDDNSLLGEMRIKRTKEVLARTDIAILVSETTKAIGSYELDFIELVKKQQIPLIIVLNKSDLHDLSSSILQRTAERYGIRVIQVSAQSGEGIATLLQLLSTTTLEVSEPRTLIRDLLHPGEVVVLVTPIDEGAPKGRLILPQQQTIREIIEADAIALVTREHTLNQTLQALKQNPALVITDSQVFPLVATTIPAPVPLTSFSILFARYRGELQHLVHGAAAIAKLRDGDRILMAEGCTHHRQCNDIGTVKIPGWLQQTINAKVTFDHFSGKGYPEDLSPYALIIHCGACMLTQREMQNRINQALTSGIPITNYGILIAKLNHLLDRALQPFQ